MRELNKEYDHVVVGRGLPSFLMAGDAILHKKRPLWIEDPRITLGPYADNFSLLDKEFIKEWGNERNIAPLIHFDDYLVRNPYIIFLDHKKIRLGDSPIRNLIEIGRKMGGPFFEKNRELFIKLMIDPSFRQKSSEEITAYAAKLAKRVWEIPLHKEITMALFEESWPPILRTLFYALKNSLFNENAKNAEELWDWRHFFLLLRSRHHTRYSLELSDGELFHLFLTAILPLYQVDQTRFESDLIHFYKSHGGPYVGTQIEDWQISKGRVWSLVLGNFIGTIFPKALTFVGNGQRLNLFKEEEGPYKHYKRVILKLSHPDLKGGHTFYRDLIYSHAERLGTATPFLSFLRKNEELFVSYFYEEANLFKVTNFKEEIFSEVKEILERITDLKGSHFLLLSFTPEEDRVLIADSRRAFKRTTQAGFSKRPALYNNQVAFKGGPLFGVERISSLTDGPYGNLTLYRQLREWGENF